MHLAFPFALGIEVSQLLDGRSNCIDCMRGIPDLLAFVCVDNNIV